MSIFILYLQILAILQLKLSTSATGKSGKTAWSRQDHESWAGSLMLEDVSLPIFIKFWDQKTSKDIKRNPATMTFRNHENSMQAEKSARHWNIIDQTCWNFGLLKKTSYTVPCHNDKENPVCKQIVTVRWNILKRNQKQITQPNCGETLCTFE